MRKKEALKTHCTYVITLLELYVHLWVGSMVSIHTLLGQDALILTYGDKWGGFLCCLLYVIKCEIKRTIVLGMLICLYSQHVCGYGWCNVSPAKENTHLYKICSTLSLTWGSDVINSFCTNISVIHLKLMYLFIILRVLIRAPASLCLMITFSMSPWCCSYLA